MKTIVERYQTFNISERYWWKVVILSFVGWILIYADRTIINPIQSEIGAAFDLTNAQLGLISSVFFLAYAIAQIPLGTVGNNIGRRLVIMFGFILCGITTYTSGIATGFGMFLIFRVLAGIGQGAYYGPQYALSTEAIPTKSLTIGTAIINSGMAFGTSGGYLLSSYLVLQKGMHWSVPFAVMAVPTIIVGILFQVLLKERVVRPEDQGRESSVQTQKDVGSSVSLKEIFTNRNLLCSFILCFCSIYANFVIITWLPDYLQTERGYTGTLVGIISSLVPWASIPGALLFARLNDKMKQTKKLVYILVPIAMIATFGIAYVPNSMLLPVLVIYGLTGKLALDPILVAFVTRNAPKSSLAVVLSAYNFIGMSGSILAPYITGWIADITGSMRVGFYLGAAMLLIGGFVFSLVRETKAAPEGTN